MSDLPVYADPNFRYDEKTMSYHRIKDDAVLAAGTARKSVFRRDIQAAMLDAWNTICTDTGCHPLDIKRQGKELFFKPGHWADLVALYLDADDVSMPDGCDWPDKIFTFQDEPGEHDPCYVVMPDGAMLPLNHHAGEGVDIARAKFIVAACNAALRLSQRLPAGKDVSAEDLSKFIGEYIWDARAMLSVALLQQFEVRRRG